MHRGTLAILDLASGTPATAPPGDHDALDFGDRVHTVASVMKPVI